MLAPILFAVAVLVTFYKYIIRTAFLSPLAKAPAAHWSCHISPWWLLWMKWTHQENRSVYDAHMNKGPVLRLAPGILSVNCYEDGLKKIYQGAFPKTNFYYRGFATYNTENVFTFEENAEHTARKRLITNTFSKSFVLACPTARVATRDVLFRRLLPSLHQSMSMGKSIEVLELNYAYSMDNFVQWQFGRSLASNLIDDKEERKLYMDGYFAPSKFTFWQYEFPEFQMFMRKLCIYLTPKWVDPKFAKIEDWNLEKCDRAQQLLASGVEIDEEDRPVVFAQALKTMSEVHSKPKAYPARLQIAGDMFAHSSAAFETSGNTMTYLMWEMCRNTQWQTRLRDELLQVCPKLQYHPDKIFEVDDIPDPKVLDDLPILHAIVVETLRLYPTVPGAQPRRVPRTCTLAGIHNIPVGTIVQSYAYSLHQTPEIFPNPHQWKPERWLEAPDQLATMKHWFWAFGSGPRMCIGSHFAFNSMKFLTGGVYANFTTTIADSGDMGLVDAYIAGPIGHRLELNFHPAK